MTTIVIEFMRIIGPALLKAYLIKAGNDTDYGNLTGVYRLALTLEAICETQRTDV